MFKPVSFYIGLRYVRAKRRSRFVSFISMVSVFGIALGVAALITVLSVMNGFDYQIRHQFFSVSPAVTVASSQNIVNTWPELAKKVSKIKGIVGSAPFVGGMGMLMNQSSTKPVQTMGILPQEESKISAIPSKMVNGRFSSLTPGSYHMVIGEKLADSLGLMLGDKVNLFTPQSTMTPFGVRPVFRQFTVSGIFKISNGFGYDSSFAYINMVDASKLYFKGQAESGLHLKLSDPFQAQKITNELNNTLPIGDYASNWTYVLGSLFKALAMEKTIMFVILLLVVAVAAFNLVSSLMMTVNDKRTEIAILRTMGASRRMILSIFVVQGGVVGLIGTLIGIAGGILLALNATDIVNWIQHVFHVQFVSSNVYFVNFLPSRLEWLDVLRVGVLAWALSFIATLYPAWSASRTQPAEALRYE